MATVEQSVRNLQMIGRLNHVAIAVPDLAAATAQYQGHAGRGGLRAAAAARARRHRRVREPAQHQDRAAGAAGREARRSPRSCERNPAGGIHHICYEVDDILAARDQLKASGARVLGDGEPRIGAHGKPVLFLHPKDFNGTLVELEQA